MPKIAGGALATANDSPTVPDGYYVVSIEKAEEKEAPSGAVQFNMQLNIDESPDDEKQLGRKIFYGQNVRKKDGSINEIGLGQVKGVVKRVLGDERANDPDFDSDELIGARAGVQVKVVSQTVNGSERLSNEITQWISA